MHGSPSNAGRRCVVVGLDGFAPAWLARFVRAGELPAIGAIAREGAQADLVSTLPATTPVAWASAVTGCSPATTGIEGILIHRPGQRLDERISGCYAPRCAAEPLWAAATRAGRSAHVVKFPLSYPSTDAAFRLDGAAGWAGLRCLHEAASMSVGATGEPGPGESELSETDAPWAVPAFAAGPVRWTGRWQLPNIWGAAPVSLHVALVETSHGPRVCIADAADWTCVLADLGEGEWSGPLIVRAEGRRGRAEFALRVKALRAGTPPRLLNTTVHELRGHSTPAATWDRHLAIAGPIEEQSEPTLTFAGQIDVETQLELFALNAEWLTRISESVLTREPWDLYMVQAHFLDWAHHMLHGGIDPRHPDFDAAAAERFEDQLLRSYRLADRLVAAVARALPQDANLIVTGDHGQDVHHSTLHVNEWLAAEGLLEWADGDDVDWSGTAAFATGNYVYLNLEGREPTGIVPAAHADGLRRRLVDGLLALTDPRTGERVVRTAAEKQALAHLGADGDGVGDVVFVLNSGYQARNPRGPLFRQTQFLREFTSGHDHSWPLDASLRTRLLAAGPSFRRGAVRDQPGAIAALAPTVAAALGIAPPVDCEAEALHDLLLPDTQPIPATEAVL